MAGPSPAPEERGPKRPKDENGGVPPEGMMAYQQRPIQQQQQRYANPYGGPHPPPAMQQAYMWAGQYGNGPPPPQTWSQQGPPPGAPPAASMYCGPTSDSSRPAPGDWNNGYRKPPPPGSTNPVGRAPPPTSSNTGDSPMDEDQQGHRPPQPYPGWSPHGAAPQWNHQQQYGHGPPPGWQGGAPPPPPPPPPPHQAHNPMYQSNWSESPPRGRPRPEMGFGRTEVDMSIMSSRNMGPSLDGCEDGSSTGGSTKDKGRGSYKCGRCGVPKKGHVCPYQPKLKRRADDPPPVLRNAAVQVEMDEFMTLRRLNIRIQGLPESYAREPYMGDSMVIAEPHPVPASLPLPADNSSRSSMMARDGPPINSNTSLPPEPLETSSTQPALPPATTSSMSPEVDGGGEEGVTSPTGSGEDEDESEEPTTKAPGVDASTMTKHDVAVGDGEVSISETTPEHASQAV